MSSEFWDQINRCRCCFQANTLSGLGNIDGHLLYLPSYNFIAPVWDSRLRWLVQQHPGAASRQIWSNLMVYSSTRGHNHLRCQLLGNSLYTPDQFLHSYNFQLGTIFGCFGTNNKNGHTQTKGGANFNSLNHWSEFYQSIYFMLNIL